MTAIGVELVANHLGSEPYSTEWDDRIRQLQGAAEDYIAHEEQKIEQSIEMAEESALEAEAEAEAEATEATE